MSSTELLSAVRSQDVLKVRRLLESGISHDVFDADGLLPIHVAAMSEDAGLVKCLVGFGADINAKDNYRQETPLFRAVSTENAPFVGDLIKLGAAVNVANAEGWSPLHEALSFGRQNQEAMVKLLLEAGASSNSGGRMNPLMLAASTSSGEVVNLLIVHGAAVNFCSSAGTPLVNAVVGGRVEIVRMLLDHGADPLLTLPANAECAGLNAVEIAKQTNQNRIANLLENGT